MKNSIYFKTTKSLPKGPRSCQIKFEKKSKFLPINHETFNLRALVRDLSDAELLVLMSLFAFAGNKHATAASRAELAMYAGTCETTISRVTTKLWSLGLLAIQHWHSRDGLRHNLYIFSNILKVSYVKSKIFSMIKSSLSEYVTVLKEKLLFSFLSLYKIKKRFSVIPSYNRKKELFGDLQQLDFYLKVQIE